MRTAGWEWCQLELSDIKSPDLAVCITMSMLIICVYRWQFFRVWNIMMSLWIVILMIIFCVHWCQFCLFCKLLMTVGVVDSFLFHLIASRTSACILHSHFVSDVVVEGCCLWSDFQVSLAFPLEELAL